MHTLVAVDQRVYIAMHAQLLRKSYNELKLLEAMSSSQNEDGHPMDNCTAANELVTNGRQQEVIEKVLKNVAVASQVLHTLEISDLTDLHL